MTEPAKANSADTKEKDPLLDKDIGKEFFSSWKSMSLAEDDPMDFSFQPPPNNKKKTFNFEKLDMGFNLDGDFEKLSSFKVDMPDFDFSSPSKKTAKAKESSDDKSSGNPRQKKDHFSFSFDFNELDGFDLDSSMPKKGSETSKKSIDCEGAANEKKGGDMDTLDFDSCLVKNAQAASVGNKDIKAVDWGKTENQNSKTSDAGVIDDSTRIKHAALEIMESSEVQSPLCPWMNNSKADAICSEPQSSNTSSDKTLCPMIEEIDEQSPSTRDMTSSPSHASDTAQAALQAHYANCNDLNGETGSDVHEVCRFGTKEDCPRGPDQNVHDKMISTTELRHERIEPKTSSRLCIAVQDKSNHEQKEMGKDTLVEITDQTGTTRSGPDTGNTPTARPPDTCANQTVQIQNSSSKLSSVVSSRLPKLDNLKAMEEAQAGPIRSRFFKRPDRTDFDAVKPCPVRLESLPESRERVASILHLANGKIIKDVQPVCGSRSYPKAVRVVSPNAEHINMDSEKNVAKINMSRDRLIANDIENGARLVDGSKLPDKTVNKERSILQRSDKDSSSQADTSSPTEKASKLLFSGTESLDKSNISSLERFRLGKIMPEMPKAKTLRTTGANKDPFSSTLHREFNCSTKKEQTIEAPGKKSSEIHQLFVKKETQMLQPSSLKRKALEEEPNVGSLPLKPLKCFAMSPSESRNPKESSLRVVEEKFCSQENRTENKAKNLTFDSPSTGLETLQRTNMIELELPMVMEKDDNVKKAEAYTKDLENICNILRKKHEEAKELLVRAVVNNNNLLMLNHPVYEQKIRMVQKFAAKLTSKDLQMQSQTQVA